MKGFTGFENNTIEINEQQIILKFHIVSIKIIENKIFVLMEPNKYTLDETSKLFFNMSFPERLEFIKKANQNNIKEIIKLINTTFCCYDYNGKLLWNLNLPENFRDMENFVPCEMVGVYCDEKEEKLYIFDFMERRYEIDINTGEVISVSASRNTKQIFFK